MTFDQQLQSTLETFAERLRGETARALATLTSELASAVAAEREAATALRIAENSAVVEELDRVVTELETLSLSTT